jgi:hypothetical protein
MVRKQAWPNEPEVREKMWFLYTKLEGDGLKMFDYPFSLMVKREGAVYRGRPWFL